MMTQFNHSKRVATVTDCFSKLGPSAHGFQFFFFDLTIFLLTSFSMISKMQLMCFRRVLLIVFGFKPSKKYSFLN